MCIFAQSRCGTGHPSTVGGNLIALLSHECYRRVVSRSISAALITLIIVVLYVATTFLPKGAIWTAILFPGLLMMYAVASLLPTSITDVTSKHAELRYIQLTFVCTLLFWCGVTAGVLAFRFHRQKRVGQPPG